MTRRWPWCDRADAILVQAIALLVGSILLSVTIQIVSRLLGVAILVWTDEVIRIAVVWLTFLGSAVGIRRQTHFVIDLFVEALSGPAKRLTQGVIWGAMAVAVLVLLSTGWQLTLIATGRVYPISRVSQAWGFAAVPAGAALMLVFLVEQAMAPPPKTGTPGEGGALAPAGGERV
jgi:TRAP-type C4-dicarboxylate transport system permease small subunit